MHLWYLLETILPVGFSEAMISSLLWVYTSARSVGQMLFNYFKLWVKTGPVTGSTHFQRHFFYRSGIGKHHSIVGSFHGYVPQAHSLAPTNSATQRCHRCCPAGFTSGITGSLLYQDEALWPLMGGTSCDGRSEGNHVGFASERKIKIIMSSKCQASYTFLPSYRVDHWTTLF